MVLVRIFEEMQRRQGGEEGEGEGEPANWQKKLVLTYLHLPICMDACMHT